MMVEDVMIGDGNVAASDAGITTLDAAMESGTGAGTGATKKGPLPDVAMVEDPMIGVWETAGD